MSHFFRNFLTTLTHRIIPTMNTLFSQWTRLLLTTISSAVVSNSQHHLPIGSSTTNDNTTYQEREEIKKSRKHAQDEIYENLEPYIRSSFSWNKIARGSTLKTLDQALMVLKTLQLTQSHLFSSDSLIVQQNIDDYFQQLDQLLKMDLHPHYFLQHQKHVISVEGLSGVGKTSIIKHLLKHHSEFGGRYENIYHINLSSSEDNNRNIHQDLWQIFERLPIIFQLLFLFVENYRFVYEIMQLSDYPVILVENYYHAFAVHRILYHKVLRNAKAAQDQEAMDYQRLFQYESVAEMEMKLQSISSAIFEWPVDLPMPELVLYFTCPSEIRGQRLENEAVINLEVMEKEDVLMSTLYSMIKGPGTVGIDTSGSFEEVFETVLEALDYYGIYSITRPISVTHLETHLSHPSNEEEVSEEIKEMAHEEESILKQRSIDFAEQPMESDDVIINRRVSMGVYGMYSKFM